MSIPIKVIQQQIDERFEDDADCWFENLHHEYPRESLEPDSSKWFWWTASGLSIAAIAYNYWVDAWQWFQGIHVW